jgi:hypothetical protein
MSIHTIATILAAGCFGIAFIYLSWLSIEENRRPRPRVQISQPDKPLKAWARIRGRK